MVHDADVYRMVNAVRRFTKKVSNSREYELLRTTISKYSKGHLNPAYGRIWIHNTETKEISYVQKSDFASMDQTVFKKGLPHQRGGHRGTIWVNNSQEEAIIDKSDIDVYLNKGWKTGRLYHGDNNHMKLMASHRHTTEKDRAHSQKLIGRIAVKHKETGKVKRIKVDQLEVYTKLGYTTNSVVITARARPVSVLGQEYASAALAAKTLNIIVQTLTYRLDSNSDKWREWYYL
jgi:putative sterol carrier protein